MSVMTGLDVLIAENLKALENQRVGLIANHTGLAREGASTIEVLLTARNVQLVSLFSPEHGIRGTLDEAVGDTKDEKTGLPIHSLYGKTRRPTTEQLVGIDTLVYDIQDIGCRFYTYPGTLRYAMEEASKRNIKMVVMDRPNPIAGVAVEGPVADADKLSFTAWHTVPVRHGMTIGELAQLMNVEGGIGAELTVVPCRGWRRSQWWDETGLTWINPSPNMRSLNEATLYPGIGLLETTNLSVGRGTDTPFEVIGAPWLDGRKLAQVLNESGLRGVRFIPIRFTPTSSVYRGEACGGINILITDRTRFECLHTGMEIAVRLLRLYRGTWKADLYSKLLANGRVFEAFINGADVNDFEAIWRKELSVFKENSRRYLIYN